MSVLKIKDENGNWIGITSIKGEKGDKGDKGDVVSPAEIGAAPAGFGLGEFGIKIANPNDITKNGFYVTNTNMPLNIFWFLKHHQYNTEGYAWQFASTVANGNEVMCVRNKIGGDWHEWEWMNPPFVNGTEYRTIERISSKVVYKKNVNGVIQYRLDGETEWKDYAKAVGAVSKSGDTVNGDLKVKGALSAERSEHNRKARTVAHNNTDKEVDFQNYGDDSNYVSLRLATEAKGIGGAVKVTQMKDGTFSSYTMLHTGNKEKIFTFGTEDLTAGTSSLGTGMLHFVYE